MNLFIIVLAIIIFVCIMEKAGKKADKTKYHNTNRGSRQVELEEWDKWSRQLLNEYNELTGLAIDYPEIKFTDISFAYDYCSAFRDPNWQLSRNCKWNNAEAIETLRIRHNLPSDDEIYAIKEWSHNKQCLKRTPNYKHLADILSQCVYRAVHERGYKYGGIDFDANLTSHDKAMLIKKEYPYLWNDPTVRGEEQN